MFLNKVSDEWVPLQEKVFTRWVVSQLKDVDGINIQNVTKDLSNGVALVRLATILTGKAPTAWSQAPKFNAQMVTNCDTALDMFTKDGVRLVGISGKDIHDNNDKLILGLIWTLILKYSIGQSVHLDSKDNETSSTTQSSKNDKDALMDWAIERTAGYPNIHNFTPYDLSVCALLDSYVPDKINYYSLDPKDTQHNSELASKVMKELEIPVLVYPEDISKDNEVDKKALLTQLSSAKVVLDSPSFEQQHSVKSTDSEPKASTMSAYTSSYVPSSTAASSSSVPTNNSTTTTTSTSTYESTNNGVTTKTTKTTTVTTSNSSTTASNMANDLLNDPFFTSSRKEPVFDSIDIDPTFSTATHEATFKSIDEDPFFSSTRKEPVFDSIDNDPIFQFKDIEFHRIESDPFFQSNTIETSSFQPIENDSILSSSRNEAHFETSTRNEPVFDMETEPTTSHTTNSSNCAYTSSCTATTYNERSVNEINTTPIFEHEEHVEYVDSEPISPPVAERIPSTDYESNSKPVEEPIPIPVEEPIIETKEIEISEPIVTVGQELEGDNIEYAGKRFGLVLTLDESEYNNGQRKIDGETPSFTGHKIQLALTLSHDYTPFQNTAGLKLDVSMSCDPEHDVNQQFIFRNDFNVIIDSAARDGMVWDVCDGDNYNPPDGTVFYLYPFHGRHNQQFIFRDGHIYAKQNGQVVTYVGGDCPLVMMQQSSALKSRQTFEIRLL